MLWTGCASAHALRLKGNYTVRGEMSGTKPCVLKVVSPTHYGPDGGNKPVTPINVGLDSFLLHSTDPSVPAAEYSARSMLFQS